MSSYPDVSWYASLKIRTILAGLLVEQNRIYIFDKFQLDVDAQLLWNETSRISLTPKLYQLLLYFLQHPGQVISRDEIFKTVWEGRIVDDSALRLAINSLRIILHDDSKSPRYISTVYKRGYRFLANVMVKRNYLISKSIETNPLYYKYHAQTVLDRYDDTHDLAVLLDAFEHASNGKRRVVFLYGDQGVGKTALLDKFLAKVSHPTLGILRTRCVDLIGVGEPFLPLLEALERRCREPSGRKLIEYLNHFAPTWLYQLFNISDHEVFSMLEPKLPHLNTDRMLREGANFFEELSTSSPLILIVDNTHWSDIFTLDLLNFLMFRSSAAKLLIIISYRACFDSLVSRRIEDMQRELFIRGICNRLNIQKS
jgi:DNA-binding winged helix-turn-helix (wHTH) protein